MVVIRRKSIFLLLAASFIFLIVIGGAVAFRPDIEEYKASREDNALKKDKIVIGTIYIECDNCRYGHLLDNRIEPYCSNCGHCGKSLEEVNKRVISNLKSDKRKYK